MYNFECRDNEEFYDNEKMLRKQFIINLLVAWCVHKQTATNLIEPKMWPLLWMEWQEILHEVGHPHLIRTIRVWHRTVPVTPQRGRSSPIRLAPLTLAGFALRRS